jgi:hypothetical protein
VDKIKNFLLTESLAQVTEEDDMDMQESEIREVAGEGGPAGGGMGDDNVEPAAIQEDVEKEREAKLALTKGDTSLYGMTKNEARKALKDAGYSDSRIKAIERHKESLINSILKEDGVEFPGRSEDSVDHNMFDGSAFGADKGNLGDLEQAFDPNSDVEENLWGEEKPYETQHNTSPQERMAHGPKGYKNSIPSYSNRSSSGFAEDTSLVPPGDEGGKTSGYNPTYPKKNLPPSRMTPEGEKGYHDSVDLPEMNTVRGKKGGWKVGEPPLEQRPERPSKNTGKEKDDDNSLNPVKSRKAKNRPWDENLDHGLKIDLAKKNKDYETDEPGKEDHDESLRNDPDLKESVDIVRLIKLAVARGYSKSAIKEMIKVLECAECGNDDHKLDVADQKSKVSQSKV